MSAERYGRWEQKKRKGKTVEKYIREGKGKEEMERKGRKGKTRHIIGKRQGMSEGQKKWEETRR